MCETDGMKRIRLDLAYDGTHFHGWAAQPGLRTVEGVLTESLETVLRHEVKLTVAGRTDAGVHASHQVAHVDVDGDAWARLPGRSDRTPEASLLTRVGGVLARESNAVNKQVGDIVLSSAAVVPEEFDARFSATGRAYRYRIDDRAVPSVFTRHVALRTEALDEGEMLVAGLKLLGEHDFLSFCKPREGATTIRTLRKLNVTRPQIGSDAGLVVVDLEADAFCHSMVRSIVGSLIEVGRKRKPATWPRERLGEKSRDRGVILAPAHGLTLERVDYPAPERYAEQAKVARQVRENPLT